MICLKKESVEIERHRAGVAKSKRDVQMGLHTDKQNAAPTCSWRAPDSFNFVLEPFDDSKLLFVA